MLSICGTCVYYECCDKGNDYKPYFNQEPCAQYKPNKYYIIRPNGMVYHTRYDCVFLINGQYDKLHYRKVTNVYTRHHNMQQCITCKHKDITQGIR
jgi:hypothetical protein